jgi:hypothetical protein
MYLIYGEVHANNFAAQTVYQGRFPNTRVPHRNVFVNVDRRIRETGQVGLNTANRERLVDDDDAVGRDEATLDIGNADPTLSIRRISQSKRQHSHSQCGRC